MKQLVTITLLYMALPSEYPIDLSLLFFLSVHEKKNYRTVFGYFIIICVFSLLKVREWEKKVFVFESSDATSNTRVI